MSDKRRSPFFLGARNMLSAFNKCTPNPATRPIRDPRMVAQLIISTTQQELIAIWTFVAESESGGWGAWSPWTACSTTCAGGTRNRYRFCDSPPPRYGAKFCEVNMQTSKNQILYNTCPSLLLI